MLNKRLGWSAISVIFFVSGVIFICLRPESLGDIIILDLEKRTFGGSLPVLMILISAVFAWLAFRETKADVLEEEKKSLQETVDRLRGAADAMEGKITTIHFRIGPDEMMSEFKRLFQDGKLEGEYIVKRRAKILKQDALDFYEDAASKTIMATVEDIPTGPDALIELVVKDGSKEWRASESVRVRIINRLQERG